MWRLYLTSSSTKVTAVKSSHAGQYQTKQVKAEGISAQEVNCVWKGSSIFVT